MAARAQHHLWHRGRYSGKVQIISRFHVDPTLGTAEATRLVHDDGAEILFAATRELLIQLTSRSLHGEFILPGVSFTEGQPEQQSRMASAAGLKVIS